jgi:hypothetical protein
MEWEAANHNTGPKSKRSRKLAICKGNCQSDSTCNAIVVRPCGVTQGGGVWLVVVGLAFAMLGPLIVDFGVSLCIASGLAMGAIGVVTAAAETITPSDEGWYSWVEGPALALDVRSKASDSSSGAIGLLSSGWGSGLAALYVLFWAGLAPGCLTALVLMNALSLGSSVEIQAVLGIISVVSILLPLYFSRSVARISTACQALLTQLNLVRMGDLSHHSRLLALETALRNLNQQQGLGIVLGLTGVVLDTKMLKQIGFTLGPAITVAVSILLGYYDQVQHDPSHVPGNLTQV